MKSTLTLLFLVFLIGCSNNDDASVSDLEFIGQNACSAENPLDVKWMQELKDSLECGKYSCEVSILKSTYQQETVFYTAITDPVCNSQENYIFYNCEGKMIKELTSEESLAYLNSSPDRKIEKLFSCNGRG